MNDEIEQVDISNLLLDPENPRLPESVGRDQIAMLDYIAETTAIEELMLAIGENGFFPGEPLVVVPHPDDAKQLLVVEGNRRLTALKLLSAPTSISNPGARMRIISQDAKHRPSMIPVVRREHRKDVLPYLGFRHITGDPKMTGSGSAVFAPVDDAFVCPPAKPGWMCRVCHNLESHPLLGWSSCDK